MERIEFILQNEVKQAVKILFNVDLDKVDVQQTKKDFVGDVTVVVFPLLRVLKGNPVEIGNKIGSYLKENVELIKDFNVVQGFLNLVISDKYYLNFINEILLNPVFGSVSANENSPFIIVEYSSPNTNKPLHLGHIRNNLLGYSISKILEASGKRVHKTQIINDRGIHICKSMVAWQKFASGATPQSTGIKGDRLVGDYYVKFDKVYKEQISELVEGGMTKENAEKQAPIFLEAQQMLRKWEAQDKEVLALWNMMNSWVYDGFEVTYKNLGVDFDSYYYESQTYLLGKSIVEKGLEKGVFYKKEDGSVWCDLTDEGLDEKLVLRADGTSIYITQDLGTANLRCEKDHSGVSAMVYVVGNEQDYHFKVLFLILKKLGYQWAENLYMLSYGMVELPNGKMKSREGTVVDADDLMQELTDVAREISQELGKLEGYDQKEKEHIYKIIGLGALKYFILKYDPRKAIKFDPKESIDFQGNTASFVQYAHARICSILRKAGKQNHSVDTDILLDDKEKQLIKNLYSFPATIQSAADNYSPALIASYVYDLVRDFNSFYQNVQILSEQDQNKRDFRVELSRKVSQTIAYGFSLLGIDVPDRM